AATKQNSGPTDNAKGNPYASDRKPVSSGPAARPNRFCVSERHAAAVARRPGWTTSTTTAQTGPMLPVIIVAPATIIANCAWPGESAPKATTIKTAVSTAATAGTRT